MTNSPKHFIVTGLLKTPMQAEPSSKPDETPPGMPFQTETTVPSETEAFDLLFNSLWALSASWCPELAAQTLPLLDRRIQILKEAEAALGGGESEDAQAKAYHVYDRGHMEKKHKLLQVQLKHGPHGPEVDAAREEVHRHINRWESQRGR